MFNMNCSRFVLVHASCVGSIIFFLSKFVFNFDESIPSRDRRSVPATARVCRCVWVCRCVCGCVGVCGRVIVKGQSTEGWRKNKREKNKGIVNESATTSHLSYYLVIT